MPGFQFFCGISTRNDQNSNSWQFCMIHLFILHIWPKLGKISSGGGLLRRPPKNGQHELKEWLWTKMWDFLYLFRNGWLRFLFCFCKGLFMIEMSAIFQGFLVKPALSAWFSECWDFICGSTHDRHLDQVCVRWWQLIKQHQNIMPSSIIIIIILPPRKDN